MILSGYKPCFIKITMQLHILDFAEIPQKKEWADQQTCQSQHQETYYVQNVQ